MSFWLGADTCKIQIFMRKRRQGKNKKRKTKQKIYKYLPHIYIHREKELTLNFTFPENCEYIESFLSRRKGLSWWSRQYRIFLQCRTPRFDHWVRKIPCRRATDFSILAWKILWTEEPGKLHTVHRVKKSQAWLERWKDKWKNKDGKIRWKNKSYFSLEIRRLSLEKCTSLMKYIIL